MERDHSLISVIVRTKDRPRVLREALESIAVQTWRPVEAVVVNDGGSAVGEIVEAFGGRLDVTLLEHERSRGRVEAANAGISGARGEWIAFLDDDDLLLPEGLEALMGATGGWACVAYGRVPAVRYPPEGGEAGRTIRTFGIPFDPDLLLFENFIPIVGCLIPREALEAVGGLDASLEVFEDWDLFLRLSDRLEFRFVDREVARYRIFGEGFITGAGGAGLQHRGRVRIYEKHRERYTPEALSRMVVAVKERLVPAELELADAERDRRLEAMEEGIAYLRSQVAALREEASGWRDRARTAEETLLGTLGTLPSETQGTVPSEIGIGARSTEGGVDVKETLPIDGAEQGTLPGSEEAPGSSGPALGRLPGSEAVEGTLPEGGLPKVSVVMVNYNGRHHLERCLPALAATRGVPLEPIVVDNGSTDGSVEWLREAHPEVVLLPQGRNLGFGAANAIGVAAASSEWIALLNTDTEVEPGWLLPLLETMQRDPGIGAACSTLRLLERPEILNARGGGMTKLGFGFDHRFGEPYVAETAEREVLFPTAAAMLMRRHDFQALGGFDPAMFMYHEDVDLGLRIWLSGQRVVVCGRSVVRHLFGGTTRTERSLAWRERLGQRHALRSLLVCSEPMTLARALKGLLGLWWRRRAFGRALHALAWNLLHLPGTLARRWRVQRVRRIRDRELFERWLILPGPWPPPAPELPRSGGPGRKTDWIENPVLRPGEASAVGRLGPGWYAAENVSGRRARPTCGRAVCWLKVAPSVTGRIELEVHVPPSAAGRTLTVHANGAEVRETLDGSLWQRVAVWTASTSQGIVTVEIDVPEWIPHELEGNWDFRRLGCAVASVRFVPDEPVRTTEEPLVTVLIPTYERAAVLERTLEALAGQTWGHFQVVVVDDGSSDGTPEVLERWSRNGRLDLVALRQENSGQGIARNRGLAHARGDLVLFLGDDTIPEPGLVEAHVAMHRRTEGPCAVVGYTGWDPETVRETSALRYANEEGPQFGYGHMRHGEEVPYTCFYTSNVSLPREVLGGEPFDPTFRVYGWEDVELGYRLALRGLPIVYAANARTRHAHPMTFSQLIRRQIRVGESLDTLLAIHPGLETDPVMPPARPPAVVRVLRPFLPLSVPMLSLLDGLGLPIPRRVLAAHFLVGFFEGRRRAAARRR